MKTGLVAGDDGTVAYVRPEALIEIVRAAVSVGSGAWIRVTGKSMNPMIRHGDRVFIGASRRSPARGAIVLLDNGGVPLLHRVVQSVAGSLITKGDSRSVCDQPHPVTCVVGQAMAVRRDGVIVCLAPTLAFGVRPLFRALAWWIRVRLPDSWAVPLRRLRQHAR